MAAAERFSNRELSWLDFNERVLSNAAFPDVPPLEKAKFCAIFSTNLDEFFQVRVAGLKDQIEAGFGKTSPDGRTPAQQLAAIARRVRHLVDRSEEIFSDHVVPELAAAGVVFSDWDQLDDDDSKFLVTEFEQRIFPVLTPLSVDPGHPFPYISSLSLNLAVIVRDPHSGERRFARVKVPATLPRFVVLPDGERFVPLEKVISAHLSQLFEGMEIVEVVPFRVTRNADLTLEEEEADDLLVAVELELRRRRFGRAVRLEIDARASTEVRDLLVRELELNDEDVYDCRGPLDLGGLGALGELDRPDLKDRPWAPLTPARLSQGDDDHADLFGMIRAGDLLVHHPYESFVTSVEEFVRHASRDPKVLAIKITLYRTSGRSAIVRSLIRAAEGGKQVAALVELKARFDEANNIEWARALEQAGVHVTYGLVGLKTHAKTMLVVRDEGGTLRRYVHIGTGNYNDATAKSYEDVGLFTCEPAIGRDVTQLFNYLTGYSRKVDYEQLLVAPHTLRQGLRALIDNEIAAIDSGHHGSIVLKLNNLVDPAMIDALYRASAAGVDVELIVRGTCCLRPGIDGLSDRITVRSMIGRYLEHSRIFRFANGAGPGRAAMFISSADLMPRNLDRRVEMLAPVHDARCVARLEQILEIDRADRALTWILEGSGVWRRLCRNSTSVDDLNAHEAFQHIALSRTKRHEIEEEHHGLGAD